MTLVSPEKLFAEFDVYAQFLEQMNGGEGFVGKNFLGRGL
jgi:hypothetical protein